LRPALVSNHPFVLTFRFPQMMRFRPARRAAADGRRSGFTLIEILVVIVVIAILATLVAPNVFQHVGAAKQATAKSQVEMLGAALDAYRLDNGRYPTTQQGLDALWLMPTVDVPTNWHGPYLRKAVPPDPWGHPYVYMSPGQVNLQTYDLISYGADGKPGGEGEDADILSWK
jgi:general secretion pathway protein G